MIIEFLQNRSKNITPYAWCIYSFDAFRHLWCNSSMPKCELNSSIYALVRQKHIRLINMDTLSEIESQNHSESDNSEIYEYIISHLKPIYPQSAPSNISMSGWDRVPLTNPISDPGSYDWKQKGSSCQLTVYWMHPSIETLGEELIVVHVELINASSMLQISSDYAPSRRTSHTFNMDSGYCSQKSATPLIALLRTQTRSGTNSTLAPTVLHILPPQAQAVSIGDSFVDIRCEPFARKRSGPSRISCNAIAVAINLNSPPNFDSNFLSASMLSRPLLCKETAFLNRAKSILIERPYDTCTYTKICKAMYRKLNVNSTSVSLHAVCELNSNFTVGFYGPLHRRDYTFYFENTKLGPKFFDIRVGLLAWWNSNITNRFQILYSSDSNPNPKFQNITKSLQIEETRLDYGHNHFFTPPIENSPIKWNTCPQANIVPINVCPLSPSDVSIESIERYNFFWRI